MFQKINKSKNKCHFFIGENTNLLESIISNILQDAIQSGETIHFTSGKYATEGSKTAKYVVIDYVDAELHPRRQQTIINELIHLYPVAKIICGTNSPFVLNSSDNSIVYNLDLESFTEPKTIEHKQKIETGTRIVSGVKSHKMTSDEWDNMAKMFPNCRSLFY